MYRGPTHEVSFFVMSNLEDNVEAQFVDEIQEEAMVKVTVYNNILTTTLFEDFLSECQQRKYETEIKKEADLQNCKFKFAIEFVAYVVESATDSLSKMYATITINKSEYTMLSDVMGTSLTTGSEMQFVNPRLQILSRHEYGDVHEAPKFGMHREQEYIKYPKIVNEGLFCTRQGICYAMKPVRMFYSHFLNSHEYMLDNYQQSLETIIRAKLQEIRPGLQHTVLYGNYGPGQETTSRRIYIYFPIQGREVNKIETTVLQGIHEIIVNTFLIPPTKLYESDTSITTHLQGQPKVRVAETPRPRKKITWNMKAEVKTGQEGRIRLKLKITKDVQPNLLPQYQEEEEINRYFFIQDFDSLSEDLKQNTINARIMESIEQIFPLYVDISDVEVTALPSKGPIHFNIGIIVNAVPPAPEHQPRPPNDNIVTPVRALLW